MDYRLRLIIEFICGLAIMVNVALLYIINRCPDRSLSISKQFFTADAGQNLLSSFCFLLIVPIALSKHFSLVYITTGLLSETEAALPLLLLLSISFASSLTLAVNSFIYKYVQLCRPHLIYIYNSWKFSLLNCCITTAIICNWVGMLGFVAWPTSTFIERIKGFMISHYDLDPTKRGLVGIWMKSVSLPKLILIIESISLIAVLGTIGSLCAWRIELCLRKNTMSSKTIKVHRQTLVMLVVQTACPALLLHAPLFSICVLLFAGLESPLTLSYFISVLMSLFPLFSAIIMMSFVNAYRNFILITLRLKKPSRKSSVATVNMTTTTVNRSCRQSIAANFATL